MIYARETTGLQVFSCEFCEIVENTFFYRTPLLAASQTMSILCSKTIYSSKFHIDLYIIGRNQTFQNFERYIPLLVSELSTKRFIFRTTLVTLLGKEYQLLISISYY